ncbi:MAG: cell envelope integrity protein TolA [Myxococcota bacterium]
MDRATQQRTYRWRLPLFLALALVLHLSLAPLVGHVFPVRDPSAHRRVRLVAMRNTAKLPARERINPPKARALDAVELAKVKGQVVDIPPTADTRPPDDARFLSEHNTRVERETRSRYQRTGNEDVATELTLAKVAPAPTPEKSANEQHSEASPSNNAATSAGGEPQQGAMTLVVPSMRRRDRMALTIDETLGTPRKDQREADKGEGERAHLAPGKAGAAPQAPKNIELVPQVGVLARLAGAPSNDHLEDVEVGEGTFLSSREFKFASFFNRIKRDVSQHWNPLGEYQQRDPSGNIYGHRSRVTVVNVTLRADGTLAHVEVTAGSGIDFLDREAIAAFSRAQPFPNPPKALIDTSSGLINFPFGFHIDFSASEGLRLPF